MNYWFIALLLLSMFELGMILSKHGEPKNDNYSFWLSLTSYALFIFLAVKAIQTGF